MVRWPERVPAGHSSDRPLTLTDVFATCAELLGDTLPDEAAEDSFSFLAAALGERDAPAATVRTSLVSHSNKGEFAY